MPRTEVAGAHEKGLELASLPSRQESELHDDVDMGDDCDATDGVSKGSREMERESAGKVWRISEACTMAAKRAGGGRLNGEEGGRGMRRTPLDESCPLWLP